MNNNDWIVGTIHLDELSNSKNAPTINSIHEKFSRMVSRLESVVFQQIQNLSVSILAYWERNPTIPLFVEGRQRSFKAKHTSFPTNSTGRNWVIGYI